MALSLKNTFLEFEGASSFGLPVARRSVSETPRCRHRDQAPMLADLRCGDILKDAVQMCSSASSCLAPAAGTASEQLAPRDSAPNRKCLELPQNSRLLLSKLTSSGFEQLQRRMQEPRVVPTQDSSHATRWCDIDASDSEADVCSVLTESTRVDSDEAPCEGFQPRRPSKRRPARPSPHGRGGWEKQVDACAAAQAQAWAEWMTWAASAEASASCYEGQYW